MSIELDSQAWQWLLSDFLLLTHPRLVQVGCRIPRRLESKAWHVHLQSNCFCSLPSLLLNTAVQYHFLY